MPEAAVEKARPVEKNVRVRLGVKGRYLLKKWRNIPDMRGVSMHCETRQIGTEMITLVALYGGDAGDLVHMQLDRFGLIHGRITRSMGPVKYIVPMLSQTEEAAFAAKIKWSHRQGGIAGLEGRRFVRYAPKEPFSKVILDTGEHHDCYVVDVSPVGALVTSEILPPMGTVLAVGKVIGRVVRHSEMGFGVEFITIQNPYTLDYDILPPAGMETYMLSQQYEDWDSAGFNAVHV